MDSTAIGEKDAFVIRSAQAGDAANYYKQNYCPLDRETARLTGCKEAFTEEEVTAFF